MTFIIIFFIGATIGSFILVLAERIPQNKRIIVSRSRCNHCAHSLAVIDLIPVFSYTLSKGRCRYCHQKIHYFHLLCELLCGMVFIGFYLHFSFQFHTLWLFLLLLMNITLSFTDLYYQLVEPKILYPMTLFCTIFYLQTSQLHLWQLVSPITIFIAFYFFQLFFPDRIGGGDIKLLMIWSFFFSAIILAKIILIACTSALIYLSCHFFTNKRNSVPFVPFLTFGFICTIFF